MRVEENFPYHGNQNPTTRRNNSEDGISGEGMSLHWLSILEDAALAARSCQSLYDARHEDSFAFSRSSSARSSLARFFCIGKKKRSKSRSKTKSEDGRRKVPIHIGSGNPSAASLLARSRRRARSPGSRSMDDDRFDTWPKQKIVDDYLQTKKHKVHTLQSQNYRSSLSGWGDSGVMDQSSDAGTSFGDDGLLTSSTVGSSRTRQDYLAFCQQQEISRIEHEKMLITLNSSKQRPTLTTTVANVESSPAMKTKKHKDLIGLSDESGYDHSNDVRKRKTSSRESPSTSEEARQGSANSSQTSLNSKHNLSKRATKSSVSANSKEFVQPVSDSRKQDLKKSSTKSALSSDPVSQSIPESNEIMKAPLRKSSKSSGSLTVRSKDSGEYYLSEEDGKMKPRKMSRYSTNSEDSSLEISSNPTADSSISLSSTSSELRPQISEEAIRRLELPFIDSQSSTKRASSINTILEESSVASNSDSSSSDRKTRKEKKVTPLSNRHESMQPKQTSHSVVTNAQGGGGKHIPTRGLVYNFREEINNLKRLESENHGCLEYHGPGITVMIPAIKEQPPIEVDELEETDPQKIFTFGNKQTFSSTLPNFLRNYKTEPTSKTLSRTFRWQTPAIYKSRKITGSNVTFENITYNYGKPPKSAVKRCLLTIVWSFAKTEIREDTESIVRVARLHLDYDLDREMQGCNKPIVHERKEGAKVTKWLEEKEDSKWEDGEVAIKEFDLDKGASNFSDTGIIMETVRHVCDSFEKFPSESRGSSPDVDDEMISEYTSKDKEPLHAVQASECLAGMDDLSQYDDDAKRFDEVNKSHLIESRTEDKEKKSDKVIENESQIIHDKKSSDLGNESQPNEQDSQQNVCRELSPIISPTNSHNSESVQSLMSSTEMKQAMHDDFMHVEIEVQSTADGITSEGSEDTKDLLLSSSREFGQLTNRIGEGNTPIYSLNHFSERDMDFEDRPFATSSPKSEDFFDEYDLLPHRRVLRLNYDIQHSFRSENLSPVTNAKPLREDKHDSNLKLFPDRDGNKDNNLPSTSLPDVSDCHPTSETEDERYFSPLNQSFYLGSREEVSSVKVYDSSSLEWYSCEQEDSDKHSQDDIQEPNKDQLMESTFKSTSEGCGIERMSEKGKRSFDNVENFETKDVQVENGFESDTDTLVRGSSEDEDKNDFQDEISFSKTDKHADEMLENIDRPLSAVDRKDDEIHLSPREVKGELVKGSSSKLAPGDFLQVTNSSKRIYTYPMTAAEQKSPADKNSLIPADSSGNMIDGKLDTTVKYSEESKTQEDFEESSSDESIENGESLVDPVSEYTEGNTNKMEEDAPRLDAKTGSAEFRNITDCDTYLPSDEENNIQFSNKKLTESDSGGVVIDASDDNWTIKRDATIAERDEITSEISICPDMKLKTGEEIEVPFNSEKDHVMMHIPDSNDDDKPDEIFVVVNFDKKCNINSPMVNENSDEGQSKELQTELITFNSESEKNDVENEHIYDLIEQRESERVDKSLNIAKEDYQVEVPNIPGNTGSVQRSPHAKNEVSYGDEFFKDEDGDEDGDNNEGRCADFNENNGNDSNGFNFGKGSPKGEQMVDERNKDYDNDDERLNENDGLNETDENFIENCDSGMKEDDAVDGPNNNNIEEDDGDDVKLIEKDDARLTKDDDEDDDDDGDDEEENTDEELKEFEKKKRIGSSIEICKDSEDECGDEYDIEEDIEEYFREYGSSPQETSKLHDSHSSLAHLESIDSTGFQMKGQEPAKELEAGHESDVAQEGSNLSDDSEEMNQSTCDKNGSKSSDASSTSSEESRIFSGFRKLFIDFFKPSNKERMSNPSNDGLGSDGERSSSEPDNKPRSESVKSSFKNPEDSKHDEAEPQLKDFFITNLDPNVESEDDKQNGCMSDEDVGSQFNTSQFAKSTFYEFHMSHRPKTKEDAGLDLKVVKTVHEDSNNIIVQVFARNDLILHNIEAQLMKELEEDEDDEVDGCFSRNDDKEWTPDEKAKKCPTQHTGTGRASRSSSNNQSNKPSQQREGFLSPAGRRRTDGRSRSPSGSPNRRNPSADKRRARNRLLAQAEVSPPMETMEENFGFLPNRVTVQITPSKNDQITATLNTVENFYRMIGQDFTPEKLAQLSGLQASSMSELHGGAFQVSGFMANHSQMRDQLERVFRTTEQSRMRSDGTPVDREERGQEDHQHVFDGKWVPVYDCTDKDGNVIKLPGMATAEWMTLTDSRGQYSTAGGGRIFARKRRDKNLAGSDEAGSETGSAEENFLDQAGPETEHLTLTSTRENRMRLIYFLDKTEEASAAATRLVSDVISSPDTEGSFDGLNEEEPGLTDQIMLIFSSSDLAAGAFGGVGGDPIPEPWDESMPVPTRKHPVDDEDVTGVIESNDNGTRTPEMWATIDEESISKDEVRNEEDRRAGFCERRWFSDEGNAIFSRPSREELKRRHKSIEDGISSFDSKINNLNNRIQKLRRTPEGNETMGSFQSATSQFGNSSSFYQSASEGIASHSSYLSANQHYTFFHETTEIERTRAGEIKNIASGPAEERGGAVKSFQSGFSGATATSGSSLIGFSTSIDAEGLGFSSGFDPVITAHEYAEMISVFKYCSVRIKKALDARRPVKWTDDRPPVMILPPRYG